MDVGVTEAFPLRAACYLARRCVTADREHARSVDEEREPSYDVPRLSP